MLTLKTNPYREMVQSAMWSQYSARLFANTNSKDELFILIRSSADWQNNKWVMKSHSSSSVLTAGWSNDCFFAFCKKFLSFSYPQIQSHVVSPTRISILAPPPLCFSWLLRVLSFVIEMTRPESKWHYVKNVSCDSCQAISLLLYSSFRIKLETVLQGPHNLKKLPV